MVTSTFLLALKIVLSASIFFVWVVRYDNIISEFQEYQLPNWLRDFVGICKLSFCGVLISGHQELLAIASAGMCFLMFAAFLTHLRFKHPIGKMIPSVSLLIICSILLINS